MSELWSYTLDELVQLIARQECTHEEIVQAYLSRIDAIDETSRSWAWVDADSAIIAAKAADARRRAGDELSALDGFPIGVKDVIHVKGMPTRAGSRVFDGAVDSTSDSEIVSQWKSVGGVVLGKTETYEFAIGQSQPPTENPRDPRRYAGGSSIGSGVAVAVGTAPVTLGTDTGGSIRNPAAVNGLVGLKPSRGAMSTANILNISSSMDAVGPIARTPLDVAWVLETTSQMPQMLGAAEAVRESMRNPQLLKSFRVGIDLQLWESWKITAAVRTSIESALKILERAGLEVVEVSVPEYDLAFSAGLMISLSEAVAVHRELIEKHAKFYEDDTRRMIVAGALLPGAKVQIAREFGETLLRRIESLLETEQLDALLTPTLPTTAPLLERMNSRLTDTADEDSLGSALRILSAANLTGIPALSIPTGASRGLPVGMQLVGSFGSDVRLLCAAAEIQQELGGPFPVINPSRHQDR